MSALPAACNRSITSGPGTPNMNDTSGTGCSASSVRAKCTLKRQKSASSQAESISACCAVLDCPSIVAALSRARHGPASRSAALRKTAARSSKDSERHASPAASEAWTARSASWLVPSRSVPSTSAWACGCTTWISAPEPTTSSPPITCGRSIGLPAISTSVFSSSARLGVPGA